MRLLAIDPGTAYSAYVVLNNGTLGIHDKVTNADVLAMAQHYDHDEMVIELVASYGMPVGREVFETVFWAGRFHQATKTRAYGLYRQDVKLHLCKSPKANDASIRQALIDRFGPGKEKAIGTKKSPGPLYGVTKDCWAALALGVTFWDRSVNSTQR